MAALDLLRENYANSLIITTFAEIIKKDVMIFTVHGVIILFPLLKVGYGPFCACAGFVYVLCFDPH